jgi:hypothetical protein
VLPDEELRARADRPALPEERAADEAVRALERLLDELDFRAVGWRVLAARVFDPDFDVLPDLELELRVDFDPPER